MTRPVSSEFVSIPMADGVVLSGRLWLPERGEPDRFPAIVSCHPYRVTDMSAIGSESTFAYFAARGYGCLQVDLRGSGNSGGVLLDEYLAQEQADNVAVIEWAAAQPWCDGSVGWTGISWGGFAGLQVAALRPPALKAVVSICSTDDRYADDVHYRGGCMLGSDMLPWAASMLLYNALPPDPEVVGPAWREMWRERLEGSPPYIEAWLAHQGRDEYWRHGSVCEDFARIETPVLLAGGWSDGYTDAVFRMMEGLSCPWRAIVGPWAHGAGHDTGPGPAIGFLHEELRWFDQWLKGEDTGVLAEAPLRAWLVDSVAPSVSYRELPGHWVGVDWPGPVRAERLYLAGDGLTNEPGANAIRELRSEPGDGFGAGQWCPGGAPGDFAGDQRDLDDLWLSYTTEPLAEPLTLLGNAALAVEVASNSAGGEVVARLCEVSPGGASRLLAEGMLNLRFGGGFEAPRDLTPGVPTTASVQFKAVGCVLAAGNRLRVSLASGYFPRVWPSGARVRLHEREGTWLSMPVLDVTGVSTAVSFGSPEHAPLPGFEVLSRGSSRKQVVQDVLTGERRLEFERVAPAVRLAESGIEFGGASSNAFAVSGGGEASVTCVNSAFRRRGEWDVRVQTESTMAGRAGGGFVVTSTVRAFEGEDLVWESRREVVVPRA